MSRVIAIDVETEPFSRGNMAPRVICLSVHQDNRTDIFKDDAKEVAEKIFRSACLGETLIVGHSVAYDCACLLASFPSLWDLIFVAYQANAITCTSIRERLLDIANGEFRFHVEEDGDKKHGYDLADLVLRRLGIKLDKGDESWRLKFKDLKNIPVEQWPQRAVEYSKADAESTYQLFQDQEIRAKTLDYFMPTQFDDTRADFALRLMSAWGISVDTEKVRIIQSEGKKKLWALGKIISASGLAECYEKQPSLFLSDPSGLFGDKSDPEIKKNNKKIQAAVLARHPNPPRTEKGNVKIDAETLWECKWKPFDDLIEFNSLQKTISTYLSKLTESPIHASFFAIGAESGRTSCSNPNLQNQPRLPGVRECFIPRPGFVFLAADFSSQEMRTLAQVCLSILGFSRLAEKFQADKDFDPHMEFAKLLSPENPGKLRQQSKAANFGYPGGMGPEKFIRYARTFGLDLTLDDSELLREKWFRTWPEMKKFFNFVSNLTGDHGEGKIKIPQSGFIRGGLRFTDACNSYFQGLAAHASKRALWEVVKACYNRVDSYLYGSRVVLFLHDELLLEVPEEAGHEAAQELVEIMETAQNYWTPDVPAKAEAVLMRYWTKKAKPIFENGRLTPWEEQCD